MLDTLPKIFEHSILAGILVAGMVGLYRLSSLMVKALIAYIGKQADTAAKTKDAVEKSSKALEAISLSLIQLVDRDHEDRETMQHVIQAIQSVIPEENQQAKLLLEQALRKAMNGK